VGQTERNIDLDVDRVGFDAEDGGTAQAREHDACSSARNGAASVCQRFARIRSGAARERVKSRDLRGARSVRILRTAN
jgi:hypothetical protein